MRFSDLVMLLPHLGGVVVERVERCVAGLRLWARGRARRAVCPRCGGKAGRVHSRYERRLEDVALAGEPVQIRLRVRRFFCDQIVRYVGDDATVDVQPELTEDYVIETVPIAIVRPTQTPNLP